MRPSRCEDSRFNEKTEGHVRIDLIQADLDVSPPHPPKAKDVVAVIPPPEKLTQPLDESAFEAFDLVLAACDDLALVRLPLDFGIEIVDQRQ